MKSLTSESSSDSLGVEWNKSKTMELINLYQKFPVLWDIKCSEYKNNSARLDALNEIADEIGYKITNIERKITTIRSQYFRELAKVKAQSKGKSSWYAFNMLSFLKSSAEKGEHAKPKNNKRLTKVEKDKLDVCNDVCKPAQCDEPSKKCEDDSVNMAELIVPVHTVQYTPKRRRPECSTINTIEEQIDAMASRVKRRKDVFDCFGEYIAQSLRDLDDARLQFWARQNMTNVLQAAEMRKIEGSNNSTGPSTTSLPSTSPPPFCKTSPSVNK